MVFGSRTSTPDSLDEFVEGECRASRIACGAFAGPRMNEELASYGSPNRTIMASAKPLCHATHPLLRRSRSRSSRYDDSRDVEESQRSARFPDRNGSGRA